VYLRAKRHLSRDAIEGVHLFHAGSDPFRV
jgi:hypothetical protein